MNQNFMIDFSTYVLTFWWHCQQKLQTRKKTCFPDFWSDFLSSSCAANLSSSHHICCVFQWKFGRFIESLIFSVSIVMRRAKNISSELFDIDWEARMWNATDKRHRKVDKINFLTTSIGSVQQHRLTSLEGVWSVLQQTTAQRHSQSWQFHTL